MSSSGPLLRPSTRAWIRAPHEARCETCFFVKFQDPLCHAKLDNTDALKQAIRFVRSKDLSQRMLDHFSKTPVAFWILFIIADSLFPQRWIFAPTNVIFSVQGIVCSPIFKFVFGECVELVQKVVSSPVSKPASKKTLNAFFDHELEVFFA